MSTSSDERFYGLAIKAAAGKVTPAEQAELDAVLGAEPGRVADFEQVKKNARFAATVVPVIYEQFVEVAPLPEVYRQRLHKRVAEVFGPAKTVQQAIPSKELSADAMEVVLLSILSQRPMDGIEICAKLETAKACLLGQPQLAIYRLLENLEMSGHLGSKWIDGPSRKIKVYHLTQDLGWPLLRSSTVTHEIGEIAASVLQLS